MLAGGQLKVRIDRVLPLSAASDAHRLIEGNTPWPARLCWFPDARERSAIAT